MIQPTKSTPTPPGLTKVLGVPQSHSDVINREPSCLLIGYGWVGQHVNKYFPNAEIYSPEFGGLVDKEKKPLAMPGDDPKRYKKIINQFGCVWDVAFISTPTSMNPDGSCDTSIVEESVAKWERWVKLFIIRSTVVPGTTDRLAKKYGVKIVMQPEYIGETLGHPLLEPKRDGFLILGGDEEATRLAAYYWSLVMHADVKIRQVDGKTAEYCKYMENCFLATKVMFVNDWARMCRASGVDFLTLREAWLDDPRIGRSHTLAYPDNPGFSGKCLPKDLNSIANYSRNEVGQPLELIEFILKMNAKIRKNVKTEVPLLPSEDKVKEWNL